ncbi:MAG TPA: Tad domain-containing protein [Geminicoccaceae bacterium]|nr:Tad domain-containing protein [Geminicoccaceae bacterium]
MGAFARADDGAMTVLALIMTVMLLGFGALVADIGRLYNLHSQMQSYVDQVALAAAAELDGEADAIERATRAALGDGANPALVRDVQNFAVGDAELAIEDPEFYSALPADNAAGYEAALAAFATTDPAEARFVRIVATPRQENLFLMPLAAAIGSSFGADVATTATAEAQAIAGFTREVCNAPPVMICNPYERATPPYGGPFTPIIGQQVLLKTKGSGSAWAPGNFGFLQAIDGAGAPTCTGGGNNRVRCVLGLVDPNTQCIRGVVDTKPGQGVSAHAGLNVRFDIWDNNLAGERNNAAFRPSANVTKGKVHAPNQCSSNRLNDPPVANQTVPLPRDTCFATNSCATNSLSNARFGNGITDAQRSAYWATNHGGTLPAALNGALRYDIYRYEIDNNLVPNKSPTGENGRPSCAPAGINNPERDRRVLTVAILNCREHDIRGQRDDIPVIAFARMFITEPVGYESGREDDLYVEMLGVAEPGDESGILHDYPVLYR